jgi:hypothetical protein
MAAHDSAETLHYVDPPYVPETRSIANKYDLKYAGGMYAHEMDAADHAALLQFVRGLSGTVILSGYAHDSYDAALPDWHRVERPHLADGAKKRTEVLVDQPRCERGFAGSGRMMVRSSSPSPLHPIKGKVRPDDDNLLASCKMFFDGIALGLGVNDNLFRPQAIQWADPVPHGKLIIGVSK